MLLTKEFIKDIKKLSTEKRLQIINKLSMFESEIQKNIGMIRQGSPGFWIIGLEHGIYKFRLNSKDRILFLFKKNHETGKRDVVHFLRFVSHDEQIRVAENLNINKQVFHYDTTTSDYEDEKLVSSIVSCYINQEQFLEEIPGIVVDDHDLSKYFIDDVDDYVYYLSDEQYEALKISKENPIILKGAGGTGKTIVLLNKLLGLSANEQYTTPRIGYVTYTELLMDHVKEIYFNIADLSKSNATIDFISLAAVYKKYTYISRDEVILWIEQNKHAYPILNGFSAHDIYSEIHGIIKAYLGLDITHHKTLNDIKRVFITLDEYLSIPSKYSLFNEEEKKEMYRLTCNYQKMLDEKNLKDENDITLQLIQSDMLGTYDYLVLDEVQDLNELQLLLLLNSSKDINRIIWAGDFNQIVHPTFFQFARISNLYYLMGNTRIKEFMLTKNFRTTAQIIAFINKISNYRKTYISGKEEYKEVSTRQGCSPLLISSNPNNLRTLLQLIYDKMYCALIVSDNSDKEKLIKEFPPIEARIFTIQEIKGLEYDNIYCYNLISSKSDIWYSLLNGKYKNDESKRYYFNLLYVAISRAKNVLCFYEDNIEQFQDTIFSDFSLIKSVTIADVNVSNQSTVADVKKEITRLEKTSNYKQVNALRKSLSICTKSLIELRSYLKEKNGYNCLIYDLADGYTSKCIGNNIVELVDISEYAIEVSKNNKRCTRCFYEKFCILTQTNILSNSVLEAPIIKNPYSELIEIINERINVAMFDNATAEDYYYVGQLYFSFEEYKEAIFYLTKAIRKNKKYNKAHYSLARIFKLLGRMDDYNRILNAMSFKDIV